MDGEEEDERDGEGEGAEGEGGGAPLAAWWESDGGGGDDGRVEEEEGGGGVEEGVVGTTCCVSRGPALPRQRARAPGRGGRGESSEFAAHLRRPPAISAACGETGTDSRGVRNRRRQRLPGGR